MQHPISSAVSILLTLLLAAPAPLFSAAPQQEGSGLKLLILEGEGAVNNVKQRTAREVIVEVRDENDNPVGGAVVMFTLPDRGPSGLFANGQKVAFAEGGDEELRPVLEVKAPIELRAGVNRVVAVVEDDQGLRTRSTFVVRGETEASVDADD